MTRMPLSLPSAPVLNLVRLFADNDTTAGRQHMTEPRSELV